MKIVAFTGPAGSGKSTCAKVLIERHGYEKLAFAAILKRGLAAMGMPEPATQDEKEAIIPGLGFSWRKAAQMLGTEWGRGLNPDIWVKLTMAGLDPNKAYVIEDLRFENEARAVRDAGGHIVHITHRMHAMTAATSMHASEQGILFRTGDLLLPNRSDLITLTGLALPILMAEVQ